MDESVAVVEDGADDDEQEGADDEPSERLDLGQDDHKDELDRVHQRVEAVLEICRKILCYLGRIEIQVGLAVKYFKP